MIGCLRTRVHKQPIIALYFESKNELKYYNLEAWVVLVYIVAFSGYTHLFLLSLSMQGVSRFLKSITTVLIRMWYIDK